MPFQLRLLLNGVLALSLGYFSLKSGSTTVGFVMGMLQGATGVVSLTDKLGWWVIPLSCLLISAAIGFWWFLGVGHAH